MAQGRLHRSGKYFPPLDHSGHLLILPQGLEPLEPDSRRHLQLELTGGRRVSGSGRGRVTEGPSASRSQPGSDFASFSGLATSATGVLVRCRFLAAALVPLVKASSTRFPKSRLKIHRNFSTQSSKVRQSRSSGGAWILLSCWGTSSCRFGGL